MANDRNRGGGGESRRKPYDPNLDVVYSEYKARDEKLGEGVLVQLVSYNGNEPRVKVVRYYRDERDKDAQGRAKWKQDTQRVFPRFRIIVLSWLLSASREIDKGYDEWERAGHRKQRPDSAPPKTQTPKYRHDRAERDRGRK